MTRVLLLGALAWLALGRRAWADVQVVPAPSVLVLHTEATPETGRREKALFDQLSLALDDFSVVLTPPPVDHFETLTLPLQVGAVLPVAQNEGAVAVVWLVLPAPRQVMVHVVAHSTGRSLVKTVEASVGPHAEQTLAIVVRELLGAAYLFEPPTKLAPELRTVVAEVRQQVTTPEPVAPPPVPWSRGRVSWLTAARFADQLGGALRGGLSATWALTVGPLQLGPRLEVIGGPVEPTLLGVEGLLGVDVFWPVTKALSMGPFVAVEGGLRWQQGSVGDARATALFPALAARAGLRLSAPISPKVSVLLEFSGGVRPLRSTLLLGDQVLHKEGWAEVCTAVGIQWEGP